MPTSTDNQTLTAAAVHCRDMRGRDIADVVAMAGRLAAQFGEAADLTADFLRREAFSSTALVKILVAETDGVLVGYAALLPTMQLQSGMRGMELHHLHVDEKFRGIGIGRSLLAASLERARGLGCRFVTLGARIDTGRSRDFYERWGFEPVDPAGPDYRFTFGNEAGRLAG